MIETPSNPRGVKKFVRRFTFEAPDSFTVEDEVETEKAQIITSYLHADNLIKQLSPQTFESE